MSRPRSDLEALREDLQKVYDGDPWHGSSITEVLKGVDADVDALTADDLVRWIENYDGTGYTVGTVIRGLLQHHTYHEGQIAILKRAAETAGHSE
jgi:hypothetical protein